MTRLDRLVAARLAHAHTTDAREAALAASLARPTLIPRRLTIADADRLRADLHARYFGARNAHEVILLPDARETAEAIVRKGVIGRSAA
ncbi:MAG: hypothetical protein AB7I38_18670 [Dehalococcoidia bacterium]